MYGKAPLSVLMLWLQVTDAKYDPLVRLAVCLRRTVSSVIEINCNLLLLGK